MRLTKGHVPSDVMHALRICGPGNWEGAVARRLARSLVRRGLLRRSTDRNVFCPAFRRRLTTTKAGIVLLGRARSS